MTGVKGVKLVGDLTFDPVLARARIKALLLAIEIHLARARYFEDGGNWEDVQEAFTNVTTEASSAAFLAALLAREEPF